MVPDYTYIITDTGIPVILVIGGIPVDRAQRSRAEIGEWSTGNTVQMITTRHAEDRHARWGEKEWLAKT